jgi:hypothetical protein
MWKSRKLLSTSFPLKAAETITAEITNKPGLHGQILKNAGVSLTHNQAAMAGVHSGIHKRIFDLNPLAVFTACNNHSLSLVGV